MPTAYDQLAAPIREELAAVTEFDQRLAEATAEHSALSKRYSADVLKKRPSAEAIAALASSSAKAQLLREAREGSDARVRELCAPLAKFTTERYKVMRRLQAQNLDRAKAKARGQIANYFDPEFIDAVIDRTQIVHRASYQFHGAPSGSVGYIPESDSIHPDVTPQRVLDESAAVERAIDAAEKLAREL